MKRILVVCVFFVFVLPGSLVAKGPTLKVKVTGGDLATPMEITDPGVLKNFQVWAGAGTGSSISGAQMAGFIIDWSKGIVAKHVDGLGQYEVTFYSDRESPVYIVGYEHDPATGKGYVYLPGKGHKWWERNSSSILRRGFDGNWLSATEEWQRVVVPLIKANTPVAN